MRHATQRLRKKCACGGSCGGCNQESQLRRTAIVSDRRGANMPGGTDDPIHQPMLDERRAEGFDPGGFPDAYFKYGCPPGQSSPRSTVTVQPVRIARDDGSHPTNALPLGIANTIWNRCCVSLNVLPTMTLNSTASQAVDDFGTNNGPTAEENAVSATVGAGNQINLISIRAFTVNGTESTATWGGGVTFGIGSANPMIYLVQSAVGEVVAHEIGHALGFPGNHPNVAGTIMEPSGSPTAPNPPHVNNWVCQQARTAALHTMGPGRCCRRFT